MALIKDGQLINDPFVLTADVDNRLPDGRAILVSLDKWQQDRESLIAHNGLVGVKLTSEQLADTIADDLLYISLVVIEFPVFSDGRGFSTARTLREQYGYDGEIRAVGHIIRDQFLFLHRCGVNAVEVPDEKDLDEWNKAMDEISLFYQAMPDHRTPVMSLRRRGGTAAG